MTRLLLLTREDIPEYDRFEPQLLRWIADERLGLEEIRELICRYIAGCLGLPPNAEFEEMDDDERWDTAWNTAHSAVEELIYDLDVNPVNRGRLMDYVEAMDSYNAYDRLLGDFQYLLSPEARAKLLATGRQRFIPEVTVHWSEEVLRASDLASLLVQGIIEPVGSTPDGRLVEALSVPWKMIVGQLKQQWELAFRIPAEKWEELIAAAFDRAGYDEVILTPRSGDHGRDVIAVRHGVGSVRIIGSVKAYQPGHLVRYDDIRALIGVLHGDRKASKGIITTTSDFPANLLKDPFIEPFVPYRLELMNGAALKRWLESLLDRD